MIKNLEIKNYKSIKHLALTCKKVNLFIGKPNTGKSNLLESLGIFSLPYISGINKDKIRDIIRFENTMNLFFDQDISEKIVIKADNTSSEISFENGNFSIIAEEKENHFSFKYNLDYEARNVTQEKIAKTSQFKFYRFKVLNTFIGREPNFLLPPNGINLLQVLLN